MNASPVGDASFEGEFTVKDGVPVKALAAAAQRGMQGQFDKQFGQIILGAAACAVGLLPGGNSPIVVGSGNSNALDSVSAQGCCSQLYSELQAVGADQDFVSGEEAKNFNPSVIGLIFQLVQFFLNHKKA